MHPTTATTSGACASASCAASDRTVHQRMRLADESAQMRRAPETLRVDLDDIPSARWPRREPPVRCRDLQPLDRRLVPSRPGQFGGDRVAGQRLFRNRVWRQQFEARLLLRGSRRINPRVIGGTEVCLDRAVMLAWVLAGARAVISAARRPMMRPSLSVAHTVASPLRKLAPALSSPAKQQDPSNKTGTNHLKPTAPRKRDAVASGRRDRSGHCSRPSSPLRSTDPSEGDARANSESRRPGTDSDARVLRNASRCRVDRRRHRWRRRRGTSLRGPQAAPSRKDSTGPFGFCRRDPPS